MCDSKTTNLAPDAREMDWPSSLHRCSIYPAYPIFMLAVKETQGHPELQSVSCVSVSGVEKQVWSPPESHAVPVP